MKRAFIALLCAALVLCAALPFVSLPASAETPVSVEIAVAIALEGTEPEPAERYTLRMTAEKDGAPMPGGGRGGSYDLEVTGGGSFKFPAITFAQPGSYDYTIRQLPGSHPRATGYDGGVYELTVQALRVSDDALRITAVMNLRGSQAKVGEAAFTNVYTVVEPEPAVVVDPPVRKRVTGDAPPTGASFRFRLAAVSNTAGLTAAQMPMPAGAVNGELTMAVPVNSQREFGEMRFVQPGTYVYRITEDNDGQANFTYDRSAYTLTSEVTEVNHALLVLRTIAKDGVAQPGDLAAFDFTNTYAAPANGATAAPAPAATPTPTRRITGSVAWVDEGNAHNTRPQGVTIRLYANGAPVEQSPVWVSRGGDNWSFVFENLPEVDAGGNPIQYTIGAEDVNGYTASVSGTTATYRLIPRTPEGYGTVSGSVIWHDSDNAEGVRPASVTVTLLRDGVVVGTRVVTAGSDWRFAFEDLPMDDGYGNAYSYSVRAEGTAGYFDRVDGYDIHMTRLKLPAETGGSGVGGQTTAEQAQALENRRTGTPPPGFEALLEDDLAGMIEIMDYDTPLWGGLMDTGDDVPVYPFVFAGLGLLALAALAALRRKKHGTIE